MKITVSVILISVFPWFSTVPRLWMSLLWMWACVEAAELRRSLWLRCVPRTPMTLNLKMKVMRTSSWQAPRPMIQSRFPWKCSRMLHHNHLVVISVNDCLMTQIYGCIQETIVTRYVDTFYRAMHFSAKHGIAVVSWPSVRLSVTFRYRDPVGWNSSKIISGLISLGSLLLRAPTSAIWFNGNTSNTGVRVKVRIFHRLLIF